MGDSNSWILVGYTFPAKVPVCVVSDQEEEGLLVGALKSLPHLRSFRWYGGTPSVTFSMLDALAGTCGLTLIELVITWVIIKSRRLLTVTEALKVSQSIWATLRCFASSRVSKRSLWMELSIGSPRIRKRRSGNGSKTHQRRSYASLCRDMRCGTRLCVYSPGYTSSL